MTRTVFVPGAEGVDAYRLLTALVVPRPIAWVSTLSPDGAHNLAPHSFTGEFVVSLASRPLMDHVNATSARLDRVPPPLHGVPGGVQPRAR